MMKNWLWVKIVLIAGLLVIPTALNYVVYWQIQDRLGVEVKGEFRPSPVRTIFTLEDIDFKWKDEVKVSGGALDVQYKLVSFLRGGPIRVEIQGDRIQAELLNEMAQAYGVGVEQFEIFSAEIEIGLSGIEKIHSLQVKSPSISFNIQESTGQRNIVRPVS